MGREDVDIAAGAGQEGRQDSGCTEAGGPRRCRPRGLSRVLGQVGGARDTHGHVARG